MQENEQKNKTRNRALFALAAIFIAIGIGFTFYYETVLKYLESTDNAYVGGNIVVISSQIQGTVAEVLVDDTQAVKKGQLLIKLDDKDEKLSLEKAEENLAKVIRQTAKLYQMVESAKVGVAIDETNLKKAQMDFDRRNSDIGVVSSEELSHANDALQTAKNELKAKMSDLEALQKETNGVKLEQNPLVLLSYNELKSAVLNEKRTSIFSPIDGVVAKRSAQVGEKINAGSPLMAVVGLDDIWIDANFKETQLKNIHIGQPVKILADIYGKNEPLHGNIVGFSAGTGSVFSLLPPQNASGNWIKIVQRVPVRIAINKEELKTHPLKIGMSTDVTVNASDKSGKALGVQNFTPYKSSFYGDADTEAQKIFERILKENR